MSIANILPLFFNALANSIVKIPDPQPKSAISMPSQIGICSITLFGLSNVSIFFCYILYIINISQNNIKYNLE